MQTNKNKTEKQGKNTKKSNSSREATHRSGESKRELQNVANGMQHGRFQLPNAANDSMEHKPARHPRKIPKMHDIYSHKHSLRTYFGKKTEECVGKYFWNIPILC